MAKVNAIKNIIIENYKERKVIFIAVTALIVALIVFVASKSIFGGTKAVSVTITPQTSVVEVGDLDQRVTASGTVSEADGHEIFIELSQKVETVYVEVGDVVSEGQLLVTYDIYTTKKDLEDQLAEAKINLQNAQITLSELSAPANGTDLIDLQTAVISAQQSLSDAQFSLSTSDSKISSAQVSANNAETTMNNNAELLKYGAVTQTEYNNSVESYKDAVNAKEEAEQNKITQEKNVESLTLAVERAKINLENGSNKLNDTSTYNNYVKQQNTVSLAQMKIESIAEEIEKLTEATYSPIAGTIIESNAVEGQLLTDSTVIMVIADLSDLNVEAYVSEYDIAKIQVGQKVEMTSDGIENTTYMGTVTKVQPVAQSQSTISGSETVVPITIHMDAPDGLVKPGFSLDCEIIVVDEKSVEYIPISALMVDNDGSTYVFTVDNQQKISKTNVELGTYSDLYVVLKSGLDENAIFMTSPDDTIVEGTNLSDYSTVETVSSDDAANSSSNSIFSGVNVGGGGSGGGERVIVNNGGGGGAPPSGGGMR